MITRDIELSAADDGFCVHMKFVLKGEYGAVQFVMLTGWFERDINPTENSRSPYPMAIDLGYHSRYAMYENQEPMDSSCKYCDGAQCYYDGSGINAGRIMKILILEGSPGVWKALEQYYTNIFGELA